jgi:CrcB protein
MMIKTIFLVGLGGAIGSILRYVSVWLTSKYFQGTFPLATLLINILGSLFIGLFIGLLAKYFPENQPLKFLLIVGFCGGFTTFSSFASENYSLFQNGQQLLAYAYIVASVLLTIAAVGIGNYLTKFI